MNYKVVLEKTDTGYGAYLPDLPGCVAVGKTEIIVIKRIKKAIKMHIELMIEDKNIITDAKTIDISIIE